MTMATTRAQAAASENARRLGVLLALAEPADADRAAGRLGLPETALAGGREALSAADGRDQALRTMSQLATRWDSSVLPLSALGWLLERDDPELNAKVIEDHRIVEGIKRDVLNGVSFRAASPQPGVRPTVMAVRVVAQTPWGFDLTYPTFKDTKAVFDSFTERAREAVGGEDAVFGPATAPSGPAPTVVDSSGLITALRWIEPAVRMRPARELAAKVSRADWEPIAAADRERPFCGYVRWALSCRPDCPERLREQFGSWQPWYVERMRKAGIIRDLTGYLTEKAGAGPALQVLGFGRWAFGDRVAATYDLVGGLVRTELGGNAEAWAVVAQLLPEFTGTLPELLVTAGAVAHGG